MEFFFSSLRREVLAVSTAICQALTARRICRHKHYPRTHPTQRDHNQIQKKSSNKRADADISDSAGVHANNSTLHVHVYFKDSALWKEGEYDAT
jgi:hypothetical protein